MVYPNATFQMPLSNSLLLIAVRFKHKERFRMATMLYFYYSIQKYYLNNN